MSEPRAGSRVFIGTALAAILALPAHTVAQQPPPLLAPDDPASESAAPADSPLGPIETELAFRAALEEENFETAKQAGTELLSLLEAQHGRNGLELAEPLTGLARAQRHTGELTAAERNLRRALALVREHEGRYSPALLEPKVELGRTYQDLAEHDLAITTFNDAQALSRRLYGLLNLEQREILEAVTDSLVVLDERDAAEQRQQEAFHISERHHGPDSPELLPAIYEFAAWQHQLQNFRDERRLYKRAIDIIEQDGGDRDNRLIEPLRRLAVSQIAELGRAQQRGGHMLAERIPTLRELQRQLNNTAQPSASQALRRAMEIARDQAEEAPEIQARLLVDLGDWHMAGARRHLGLRRYADAWNLIADTHPALLHEWFDRPVPILEPQPLARDIHRRGAYPGLKEGHVVARYSVNQSGLPRSVEIINADPEGFKNSAVLRSLRLSRFRPRFVDGEPVATTDEQYEFDFGYFP